MTKSEFVNNVKLGTLITNGIDKDAYECVDILGGFMYSFKCVNENAATPTFALCGITDGSVKNIELV